MTGHEISTLQLFGKQQDASPDIEETARAAQAAARLEMSVGELRSLSAGEFTPPALTLHNYLTTVLTRQNGECKDEH